MFYPLKFIPVYKDYIWGGRNFEKFGRTLPEGIVAESWEISCHPDGTSIVANGEFQGVTLPGLIKKYGRRIMGKALTQKDADRFPLLVKFIDANDDLSVQVHPDDGYAMVHENGEYGKNEMWYIMSAEPGAKLVYDVLPGVTSKTFAEAVKNNKIESTLKFVEVFPGDVIDIPAGLVHAIGKGIMLAEIQQNSNATYRVYDYNRVDKNGNSRPLHIEKALDVIDFNNSGRREKCRGTRLSINQGFVKTHLISNRYFATELYELSGKADENADGSRFHIFVFTSGEGEIHYLGGTLRVKGGESVLIPADMGRYTVEGKLEALKSFVPDYKD